MKPIVILSDDEYLYQRTQALDELNKFYVKRLEDLKTQADKTREEFGEIAKGKWREISSHVESHYGEYDSGKGFLKYSDGVLYFVPNEQEEKSGIDKFLEFLIEVKQ